MHETEQETVAKCLEDLRSQEPARRRRAALVIGKYQTPEAQAAVLRCLSDTDAQVRQSALVSLTEEQALPREAHQAVLQLLFDTDVHIRRLASNLLPQLISPLLSSTITITALRAYKPPTQEELEKIAATLNKALHDKDAAVRKNILLAARYLSTSLSPDILKTFLTDEDEQIRALSLELYAKSAGNAADKTVVLQPLLKDSSPQVRVLLSKVAMALLPETLPLLQQLVQDETSAVRYTAVSCFAGSGHEEAFVPLKKLLSDEAIPAGKRATLVPLLRHYPGQGVPVLEQLLQEKSPQIRLEAVRMLASGNFGEMSQEFFLSLLKQDTEGIRAIAINSLRRYMKTPRLPLLMEFYRSPYPDVREFAIQLLPQLPVTPERDGLLLDACTDDYTAVRLTALRNLQILKPEAWEEILFASLEDDETSIQEAAAGFLCLGTPVKSHQAALQKFLPACKNSALARRIQSYLARLATR